MRWTKDTRRSSDGIGGINSVKACLFVFCLCVTCECINSSVYLCPL